MELWKALLIIFVVGVTVIDFATAMDSLPKKPISVGIRMIILLALPYLLQNV